MFGCGHPSRQRALELTPVDHCRCPDAPAPQEDAPQVLGVELLVLPDPDEGLPDDGPELVADRQLVDPSGHRLLAVRDRHDLLTFEREQPEVRSLRIGTTRVLTSPASEESLDVRDHGRFELTHNGS